MTSRHADPAYSEMGAEHHDPLLLVLADLEAVQFGYPDELVPAAAMELQAAAWEFLKAYGRRTADGAVDERLQVGIDIEAGATRAEQVGVVCAQGELEGQVLVDVADLCGESDRGDSDGIRHLEAVGSDAAGPLEVRGEGLVGHGSQHGGRHRG